MNEEKIKKACNEVLEALSNTNLTYQENIEVLKIISQAVESALYRQASIEISLINMYKKEGT